MQTVPRASEFQNLIGSLFRNRSVVAVIGAGSGSRSEEACRGIAAELAASGRRVMTVYVDALLKGDVWPFSTEAAPDRFRLPLTPPTGDWLAPLRREFDAILLDCPAHQSAWGVLDIAVLADATVLVVESGVTPRRQIQRDQRALELRGVKLAGCILMQRR